MGINTGGPAFPGTSIVRIEANNTVTYKEVPHAGMTLRDYFAAKAMQGIVSVLHQGIRPADIPAMCCDAFAIADAMLAEREKGGGQ